MDVKKIRLLNKQYNTRYITLPEEWGKLGGTVLVRIINDKELRLNLIDNDNEIKIVINREELGKLYNKENYKFVLDELKDLK